MRELQRKIKRLETALNHENQLIREDRNAIKQKLSSPIALALEIGGGFLVGFLFSRKKTLFGLLGSVVTLSFAAARLQRTVKLLNIFTR